MIGCSVFELLLLTTCSTGVSSTFLLSRPIPIPSTRRLIFDLLDDCHRTPLVSFLESSLGPVSSSHESDYFDLSINVKVDGAVATTVLIGLDDIAAFHLLSRFEDGTVSFKNQTPSDDDGINSKLSANHLALSEFWNMTSFLPRFHLVGMRSSDVEGNVEVALKQKLRVLALIYPDLTYSQRDFDELVTAARRIIEEDLPLAYSNPILSFIAFVNRPGEVLQGPYAGDAVLAIGHGMLEFVEEVSNVGNVGAAFLHAHEFSHGVDFYLFLEDEGLQGNETGASFVDFSSDELKADAMAAYVLAHKQGLRFSEEMILDSMQVASAIGTRLQVLPTDHGTPEQRECAVRWGASKALQQNETLLSPRAFNNMFDRNRWKIVLLDPQTCSFPGANSTLVDVDCPLPKPPASSPIPLIIGLSVFFGLMIAASITRTVALSRQATRTSVVGTSTEEQPVQSLYG